MGIFKNQVKAGAGNTLGNLIVTTVVLGVGIGLILAGYKLYKDGSESDQQGKKIGGIVLMVVGAIPLLGFIASGFAVGLGFELVDKLFDE